MSSSTTTPPSPACLAPLKRCLSALLTPLLHTLHRLLLICFNPLRPFIPPLLLNARSPALPGPTSHAIFMLFLAVACSITSFATTLAAGVQILQRGEKVECRGSMTGMIRWVDASEGVTFVEWEPYGYGLGQGVRGLGSVGTGWGGKPFTIFASTILPPLGTALLVGLVSLHFLARGVSNRLGIFCGTVLLVLLSVTTVFLEGMQIDETKFYWDALCALTSSENHKFQAKKIVRSNLAGASFIFLGLQIACVLIYTGMTLYAAILNRRAAITADVRLQHLRATNGASPSAHSLPARLDGPSPALENTVDSAPSSKRAASEADIGMRGEERDEDVGEVRMGKEVVLEIV